MKKIFGWLFIFLIIFLPAIYAVELYFFMSRDDLFKEKVYDDVTTKQQYLHPYYYFSFPTDKKILNELNGEYTWVDERGFGGGIGPEKKGNRKLAFVLGGSTAFGQGGSRPESAISFQLNKIQNEYFFINAGVPSWNTFQELLRLLKQVIAYKPSLVISLTGYNDIIDAYARRDLDIPFDAPDSYEHLYNWVERIRSDEFRFNAIKNHIEKNTLWGTLTFYNLRHYFFNLKENEFRPKYVKERDYNDYDTLERELTNLMHHNLELMNKVSKTEGITYKAFLQPHLYLHDSLYTDNYNFYKNIYETLLSRDSTFIYDLTRPFNNLKKNNIEDLFVGDVHLNDDGYRLLAQKIWKKLNK